MTILLALTVLAASLLVTAIGCGASINYGRNKSDKDAFGGISLLCLGLLLAFAAGVMQP